MTRKGKRRNNKPRTTRHSRNKGLGGNDSCKSAWSKHKNLARHATMSIVSHPLGCDLNEMRSYHGEQNSSSLSFIGSPLVKPGKFYGRDTRDSNHRSEDDVDEYNQEHSCVLSCQVRDFRIQMSFMPSCWMKSD